MITLKEVDTNNFNDVVNLPRESVLYVGKPEYVLAEAYIYRSDSTAYGIYSEDLPVGMVIIRDRPEDGYPYSFTELFIADGFRKKGVGRKAVEAIMKKFRDDGLRDSVEIQVNQSNIPAIKIYLKCGFKEIGRARWDPDFMVMRAEL